MAPPGTRSKRPPPPVTESPLCCVCNRRSHTSGQPLHRARIAKVRVQPAERSWAAGPPGTFLGLRTRSDGFTLGSVNVILAVRRGSTLEAADPTLPPRPARRRATVPPSGGGEVSRDGGHRGGAARRKDFGGEAVVGGSIGELGESVGLVGVCVAHPRAPSLYKRCRCCANRAGSAFRRARRGGPIPEPDTCHVVSAAVSADQGGRAEGRSRRRSWGCAPGRATAGCTDRRSWSGQGWCGSVRRG